MSRGETEKHSVVSLVATQGGAQNEERKRN